MRIGHIFKSLVLRNRDFWPMAYEGAVRKYSHWQAGNQNIPTISFDATKFREGMWKNDFTGTVFPLRHAMKCGLDRDNSLSYFLAWPPEKRNFVFACCPLCPLSLSFLLTLNPWISLKTKWDGKIEVFQDYFNCIGFMTTDNCWRRETQISTSSWGKVWVTCLSVP